jgi:cation:H+ antiporter
MLGACLAFYAVSFDGHIHPWEGWLLFAGIVGFVVYNLRAVSRHRQGAAQTEIAMEEVESDPDSSQVRNLLYLIFGLLGLAGGAHLMVESSTAIARAFGISDFVIGITIIAFGTSLPELATSVVAAFRGEADISVGNVFGSNIFNSLFVMGLIPGIFGMDVEPRAVQVDFPAMTAVILLAFPLMRTRYKLSRIEGAILLVLYSSYIASLFLFPQGLGS